MKLRRTTLLEYFGVLLVLVSVCLIQTWFWAIHAPGQRRQIEELRQTEDRLKGEVATLENQKVERERRGEEYTRQIREREDELKEYGDFLPSVATRPLVTREILTLLEELGISILRIENSPLQLTDGHYTFNFSLQLEGPYRSFKLFLARIYQSERIFRIRRFEVAEYDNSRHNMEVFVEFQTYFAGS